MQILDLLITNGSFEKAGEYIACLQRIENWPKLAMSRGELELKIARGKFCKGHLKSSDLELAEKAISVEKNQGLHRRIRVLRGEWHLKRNEWQLAADSFHEAIRMSHEVRLQDTVSETKLTFAKLQLGQIADPRSEAERLAKAKDPHHLVLAKIWYHIGEVEFAKKHALLAYNKAWADGEPYVIRYGLEQARALLEELGVEIPVLPPYDASKDERFPWEDELEAAIEKLRVEVESQKKAAEEQKDNDNPADATTLPESVPSP